MEQIPDAPWIREAERDGMPEAEDVKCPVCGEINPDEIFTDLSGADVLGCTCCVKRYDPWDWAEERRMRE